MRALVLVVVCAVAGLVLFLWSRGDEHATPATHPAPATPTDTKSDDQRDSALTPADKDAVAARSGDASGAAHEAATSSSPRCRVLGRVLDEHGAALEGVLVILSPGATLGMHRAGKDPDGADARKKGPITARTQPDGRFVIDAPLPQKPVAELAVEPDEFHAYANMGFGRADGPPRLVAGDNDVGDFQLAECGVIEGRLVGSDGSPVENAAVYVGGAIQSKAAQKASGSWACDVDGQGRFRLGHMPIGPTHFDAFAEGWTRRKNIPVEVRARSVTRVDDVVLEKAFAIAGTVVDEAGAPIARAMVRSKQEGSPSPTVPTHADGTFQLTLTNQAPCTVTVDAEGFELFGGGPDATFRSNVSDARFVLKRSPALTFHVIDARSRAPIESFGLLVETTRGSGVEREQAEATLAPTEHPRGEATWTPVRGEHMVLVVAPDHADAQALVAADADAENTQTIAMHPASGVQGRVLLGGKPLPGVTLALSPSLVASGERGRTDDSAPHGFELRTRYALSDKSGLFTFDRLPVSRCKLEIDAPTVGHKELTKLDVPYGEVLQVGDIELVAGATVNGVLLVAAGESKRDFIVTMDRDRVLPIDDAEGHFAFKGLEPGAHVLSWVRRDDRWLRSESRGQNLELAAGEVRDVTLDASVSAPCSVIVHVLRDARPASIGVTMRVRGKARPNAWNDVELGEGDGPGTRAGTIDGDTVFDLVAMSNGMQVLGVIDTMVHASPGGRIERTYEVATGKLAVEFPASSTMPARGRITVRLDAAQRDSRYYTLDIATAKEGGLYKLTDHRVEFGDVECGTYEALVTVQRFEVNASDPNASKYVDIFPPYKTSITIAKGQETKLVAP